MCVEGKEADDEGRCDEAEESGEFDAMDAIWVWIACAWLLDVRRVGVRHPRGVVVVVVVVVCLPPQTVDCGGLLLAASAHLRGDGSGAAAGAGSGAQVEAGEALNEHERGGRGRRSVDDAARGERSAAEEASVLNSDAGVIRGLGPPAIRFHLSNRGDSSRSAQHKENRATPRPSLRSPLVRDAVLLLATLSHSPPEPPESHRMDGMEAQSSGPPLE
ncbi:hypothetical protein BC830DRAFT_155714 [Chytriomyces sp. MP71]|nr:hypothetical protein BC830DRAFT_155714 [Chytriomyces sp. MP71]